MKRLVLILTVLAAGLVAAGCGGSKSSGSATGDALSFVAKDAPLVIAIDTDPNGAQWKNVNGLLAKFPGSGQIKAQFKQSITRSSGGKLDYDTDVKPILGNELIVAATSPQSLQGGSNHFVGAIKVADEGKARKILDSDPRSGSVDGTDIHRSASGGSYTALVDGVLITADTEPDIEAAIKRHGGSDHMTEGDFDKLAAGLGGDSLARIGANLQALIASSPNSANARKIKWVAALRNLGETFSAQADGIGSSFKLTTDGSLAPADLPLATGPQAPEVVRRAGELGFAIRDPAQTWHFAEGVARVTDPAGYAKYAAGRARLNQQLGIDVDRDLIGQLSGDATVSVSLDGKVALRSSVRDPRALQATLHKVAPKLRQVAPKAVLGVRAPKSGSGLYEITAANGDKTALGVIGNNFVLATDPARAAQIAGESPSRVPGASGAGVMAMDARSVVSETLRQRGQGAAALLTGALGDLVASVESETSGLSGSFKLSVK